MPDHVHITVETAGDVIFITFRERKLETAAEIETECQTAIEEAGLNCVALDFTNALFMTSELFGVILRLNRKVLDLSKQAHKLCLCHVPDAIMDGFKVLNLVNVVTILENREAVLKFFK